MLRLPDFWKTQDETEEPETNEPDHFWLGFLGGTIFAAAAILGIVSVGVKFRQYRIDQTVPGAAVLSDRATSQKIREVQNLIQNNYYYDVDSDELSAYLFRGISAGLDDDYARYYTKEEYESVQQSNDGAYYGIGCSISEDPVDGHFTVEEVYDGTPAMNSGLMVGDLVRKIDGKDTDGQDLSELVKQIRSFREAFDLTVYRPSLDQELTLTVICQEVEMKTVSCEMAGQGIGYIKVEEFDEITLEQFTEAVDTLQQQGADRLIIDLRNNPGGLLNVVCDMLDYLLPEGLLVYTEDRSGTRAEYRSKDGHKVDCEVAVLVNGRSASASEIFAGAIQDRGAGVVIGSQTFGKGVVQKTWILSDGSAMKFTVQKYFTPNGNDIHGDGITPDYIVEEEKEKRLTEEADPVLEQALEVLK